MSDITFFEDIKQLQALSRSPIVSFTPSEFDFKIDQLRLIKVRNSRLIRIIIPPRDIPLSGYTDRILSDDVNHVYINTQEVPKPSTINEAYSLLDQNVCIEIKSNTQKVFLFSCYSRHPYFAYNNMVIDKSEYKYTPSPSGSLVEDTRMWVLSLVDTIITLYRQISQERLHQYTDKKLHQYDMLIIHYGRDLAKLILSYA